MEHIIRFADGSTQSFENYISELQAAIHALYAKVNKTTSPNNERAKTVTPKCPLAVGYECMHPGLIDCINCQWLRHVTASPVS